MNKRSNAIHQKDTQSHHYKVLVHCPKMGFELAEHMLCKQLLFVFKGLPDIELAERLEALGFDHVQDEHIFTIDTTPSSRKASIALACQFKAPCKSR